MSNIDDLGPCCPPPITDLDPQSAAARRFKALGDPARLHMLTAIAAHPGGAVRAGDVAEGLELTQPTVSHHLKVLRDAGLVGCQRRGTAVYYWVMTGVVESLAGLLTGLAPAGCGCESAS